ncbi:MAG: hypothetical protein KAI47_06735 [Deltaproteobacteria bacterium]|nr:hypothetical protein [Deltaproteobacteria bacterium]
MRTAFPMEHLEVIGYATHLSEVMLPTIVTPIFRITVTEDGKIGHTTTSTIPATSILFPPFRIYQGQVYGGTLSTQRELEEFVARAEISLLPQPFTARDEHELWIDRGHLARYQPIGVVDDALRRIANNALDGAMKALDKGDLGAAEERAKVAEAADDRRIEPLAIEAALHRLRGETNEVEVIARLSEDLIRRESFESLIASYVKRARPLRSPFRNAAKKRPRDILPRSWGMAPITEQAA